MSLQISEAAILGRTLDVSNGSLAPEAAQSILDISLSDADKSRLTELSAGAAKDTLSAEEDVELENYRHVARVLELLWSKARLSQKASSQDS